MQQLSRGELLQEAETMKLLENSSFEAINSQLTVETGDAHIIGRWVPGKQGRFGSFFPRMASGDITVRQRQRSVPGQIAAGP